MDRKTPTAGKHNCALVYEGISRSDSTKYVIGRRKTAQKMHPIQHTRAWIWDQGLIEHLIENDYALSCFSVSRPPPGSEQFFLPPFLPSKFSCPRKSRPYVYLTETLGQYKSFLLSSFSRVFVPRTRKKRWLVQGHLINYLNLNSSSFNECYQFLFQISNLSLEF